MWSAAIDAHTPWPQKTVLLPSVRFVTGASTSEVSNVSILKSSVLSMPSQEKGQ